MGEPIAAFWSWWKAAHRKIDAALIARDLDGLDSEITARVQAIDPELSWELGGVDGEPALSLSWRGGLARRRLLERWLMGAPRTGKWSFHAGRPAGDWCNLVMKFGKHAIDFSRFVCTFSIDAERECADLILFHPATAKAPRNVRETAGIALLDRAFGEDGVARWIASVDFATKKPRRAVAIDKFVVAVVKLANRATGDVCTLSEGTVRGQPMFVLENRALKAMDHLACDHQLAVELAYDAMENGLPTKREAAALDVFEAALGRAFPTLVFHGRETFSGARTLYYFAPLTVESKLGAWLKKQKRAIAFTLEADPDWRGLDRWR